MNKEEIIDECYSLCESCRGLKDGHEPLVQNYLERIDYQKLKSEAEEIIDDLREWIEDTRPWAEMEHGIDELLNDILEILNR